jgi:uncharacterized protein (DUF2252 family)
MMTAMSKTSDEYRQDELSRLRNLKMARSAHAYVRGSTLKFYEWLLAGTTRIPQGPPVWICGDCHVGNLGPLADKRGRVAVQIRDLDQTVIGNPAHDVIRLALSLASAARGSDLPGVTTAQMIEELVAGYEEGLSDEAVEGRGRSRRPGMIQRLLDHSVRRRWQHLARERLDDVKPVIPLGKRFWALKAAERKACTGLLELGEVRHLVTSLQERKDDAAIELVDAAYWVKGCSSLGRLRYALLVRVGDRKDRSICLLDVKQGVAPAAPHAAKPAMPKDNAERVVAGARALSPNLGQRLIATRLLQRSVVLRELMPQDLKLEVDRLSPDEARALARYLAGVVARAHGRQMEKPVRKAWARQLRQSHSKALDAPSWLWTSVVELMATHESAYLDHCRQYALSEGRRAS